MNDLNLNPAYTGMYDGDLRLTGNYRNQWAQIGNEPIETMMVDVEKKFLLHSRSIDVGLQLVRDQFGGFNTNLNKALLSVAYAIKLSDKDDLRVGIQGGVLHRQVDMDRFIFSNQWVREQGVFNQALPNFEQLQDQSIAPDLNAGISWTSRMKKIKPQVGLAVNHINQPRDSYVVDAEKIQMRYVANLELDYYLSSAITLEPKIFATTTTQTKDVIMGTNIRYNFPTSYPLSIYVGGFNRGNFSEQDNDALIGTIGGRFKQWEGGVSYDYNTSLLSNGFDQKSSFELAIRYTTPSNKSSYVSVPCDRY